MSRARINNKKNHQYRLMDRRKRVADFYCQGLSQQEIGRRLDVCVATVCHDLQFIRDQWLALAVVDYDERCAQELARLDHLEAEAWKAWERSQQFAYTRRVYKESMAPKDNGPNKTKTNGSNQGKGSEKAKRTLTPVREVKEETRRGQCGDPRFLEQAFKCIHARLQILGLLKPSQTNLNQQVLSVNWDSLFERKASEDTIEAQIASVVEGENPVPGEYPVPAISHTDVPIPAATPVPEYQVTVVEPNGTQNGPATQP